MRRFGLRDITLYILLALMIFFTFTSLQQMDRRDAPTYSQIRTLFLQEQVEYFPLEDSTLTLTLRGQNGGEPVRLTYRVADPDLFYYDMRELVNEQLKSGVLKGYDYPPGVESSWWYGLLPYLVAAGVLGLFWVLLSRQHSPVSSNRKDRRASPRRSLPSAAASRLYTLRHTASRPSSGASTPRASSPPSPTRKARYSPSPGSSMDARISVRAPLGPQRARATSPRRSPWQYNGRRSMSAPPLRQAYARKGDGMMDLCAKFWRIGSLGTCKGWRFVVHWAYYEKKGAMQWEQLTGGALSRSC